MNSQLVNHSVLLSVLLTLSPGYLQAAIPQIAKPVHLAQVNASPSPSQPLLRGQCRALRKAAFVYKSRSLESMTIMRLDPEQQVILAESNPVNGFIAIDKPELGYIQVANLKFCGTNPPSPTPPVISPRPTPTTPSAVGLCRRITSRNGLEIWTQPDSKAFVARLPFKSDVYLTDPPTIRQSSGDRIWVRIARPVPGWAVGSIKGVTVLAPCT